jgi:hypothetical protein
VLDDRGTEESDDRAGCPPWCVADHGSQTDLEDQWHESRVVAVPAVEYWSRFTPGTWRLDGGGVELNVLLEQHVSAGTVWVSFGPGDDRERVFHLSPESIHRLMNAFEVMRRLIAP